jgi:hypothetical protein
MEIIIVKGYGADVTEEAQRQRLNLFYVALRDRGLAISEVISERETGGKITIYLPDETNYSHINNAMANFVQDLAEYFGENLAIDYRLPSFEYKKGKEVIYRAIGEVL